MHDHHDGSERDPRTTTLGWGSPIGLGVGLLCVGGFFALIALGLAILAAID